MKNKYGSILSVEKEANRRKREFSKQSWCYLQGFIWYKQGAVAPKRTWGPPIFISKFKFQ